MKEKKKQSRNEEGKLPAWTICGSVMSRTYSRALRRDSAKSQPYLPVGWYCANCDTFMTDAQYEEREKDHREKYKMFNLCYFEGHGYNYNKSNKGASDPKRK